MDSARAVTAGELAAMPAPPKAAATACARARGTQRARQWLRPALAVRGGGALVGRIGLRTGCSRAAACHHPKPCTCSTNCFPACGRKWPCFGPPAPPGPGLLGLGSIGRAGGSSQPPFPGDLNGRTGLGVESVQVRMVTLDPAAHLPGWARGRARERAVGHVMEGGWLFLGPPHCAGGWVSCSQSLTPSPAPGLMKHQASFPRWPRCCPCSGRQEPRRQEPRRQAGAPGGRLGLAWAYRWPGGWVSFPSTCLANKRPDLRAGDSTGPNAIALGAPDPLYEHSQRSLRFGEQRTSCAGQLLGCSRPCECHPGGWVHLCLDASQRTQAAGCVCLGRTRLHSSCKFLHWLARTGRSATSTHLQVAQAPSSRCPASLPQQRGGLRFRSCAP